MLRDVYLVIFMKYSVANITDKASTIFYPRNFFYSITIGIANTLYKYCFQSRWNITFTIFATFLAINYDFIYIYKLLGLYRFGLYKIWI